MENALNCLIKAQICDTFEALQIEEVNEILENWTKYNVDTIIRLCERITFLIYQDSSFGIDKTKNLEIVTKIDEICENWLELENVSGSSVKGAEWIGGWIDDVKEPNLNFERVLCASVLSKLMTGKSLTNYLKSIEKNYKSRKEVAQKLLNNDERCLTIITVLLSDLKNISKNSVFYPPTLFLEVLHLIDFDCQVVLDWLTSELITCSLLFRILKSCCNSETGNFWNVENIKNIERENQKNEEINFKWRKVIENVETPKIKLQIKEIVGDRCVIKEYKFNENEKWIQEDQETEEEEDEADYEDLWIRWVNMIEELRIKLKRLLKANLIASKLKLIVKWCDRFCDIYKT